MGTGLVRHVGLLERSVCIASPEPRESGGREPVPQTHILVASWVAVFILGLGTHASIHPPALEEVKG